MNSLNLLKSALAGALVLGVAATASASPAGGDDHDGGKPAMVKCYGVNAAHKNDCQSPGHSCAGQDSKARDPNGFVAMPAGLCEKLDGGSTHPASSKG